MRLQATALQILALYEKRGTLDTADIAKATGRTGKDMQTYTQRYEDAGLLVRVYPGHTPIQRTLTCFGSDALANARKPPPRKRAGPAVTTVVAVAERQRRVFPLAAVWA